MWFSGKREKGPYRGVNTAVGRIQGAAVHGGFKITKVPRPCTPHWHKN